MFGGLFGLIMDESPPRFGLLSHIFNSEAEDHRKERKRILKNAKKAREQAEGEYNINHQFAKEQLAVLEDNKQTAWECVSTFVDTISEVKNINLSGYEKIPFANVNVPVSIKMEDFQKTDFTFKEHLQIKMFAELFRVESAYSFMNMINEDENLEKARQYVAQADYETEQIKTRAALLYRLGELAKTYASFINFYAQNCTEATSKLVLILDSAKQEQSKKIINKVKKLVNMTWKINFNDIDENEQRTIQVIYLMNQILYEVIKQPLISPEGDIVTEAESKIESASQAVKQLPPA